MTATAPTSTDPRDHSHSPMAVVAATRAAFSRFSVMSCAAASRIWR